MRHELPNPNACPVGVIVECMMLERSPDRGQEILDRAIRMRERQRLSNKEIRNLLTLHPIRTAKTLLIVGVIAFIVSLVLSQLAALGHWYAQMKSLSVTIPVPVIGEKVLALGGFVPTSTTLGIAGIIPTFGVITCLFLAIAVMVLVLLERLMIAASHLKEAHALKVTDDELAEELKTLREWKKNY